MGTDANERGRDRRVSLSQVEAYPKTHNGPCIVVGAGEYKGRSTVRGAKLIAEVSDAEHRTRAPIAADVAESETHPGDMILIPSLEQTADTLPFEWIDKAKIVIMDMIKLLAYKKITIPEGTNMVLELYKDQDPTFGHVIGLKLTGATFEPKRKGTPRKKKGEGEKSGDKSGDKTGDQADTKPDATAEAKPEA